MGQLIAVLYVTAQGKQRGACEICEAPGWKQTSLTDPLSPALLYLCSEHHKSPQYQSLSPRVSISET